MASRPYDELDKLSKARQQDAVPKKERDLPASSQRFDELKDEHAREETRRGAQGDLAKNISHVTHGSPGHEAGSTAMRVHADKDHPDLRPPQERQGPGNARPGAMHLTPGGTHFQAGQAASPWDQARAEARTEQQRGGAQEQAKGPWDQARKGEMSDRQQAAMGREAGREVTDERQRNPFDRELSDRAQKLVDVVAERHQEPDRGGRGR
jgi:hypothetical protein